MKKEYIVYKLSECAKQACRIDNELFTKYNVKRGLRNEDGTGVLVGLTKIGNVVGYERTEEGLKPIPGKLFYRGYDLADIVHALLKEKRFGFEEVAYLLLSGELPDNEQLDAFKELINDNMPLDKKTTMNIIDLEGQNIMNILARSVLEMYTFDPNPDDISRDNLMRQSIELISKFPTIIAYAYNIYRHSIHGRSLHIRHPHENLSIAENLPATRRSQYPDGKDVPPPERGHLRLDQHRRNRHLPDTDAAQRGIRRERTDLRNRPCRIYHFRPACRASERTCQRTGSRKRVRKRICLPGIAGTTRH